MGRRAALCAATIAGLVVASAAAGQSLPLAPAQEIGLSAAALQRVTTTMQAYVDSGVVAGMVMVVARHGRIGYMQALGYMNREEQIPMRTDAVFRLASTRKPILAAAAMTLVDSGKLRLDDPVTKYIPAFASTQVYAAGPAENPTVRPPAREMTIEHLLTNTAGLADAHLDHPVDSIYRSAGIREVLRNPRISLREFVDSLARLPLEFSPGERWDYSLSMDVLGRVIELASGKPIEEYVAEALFGPLGMHETSFRIAPGIEGRIPVSYTLGSAGDLSPGALEAAYLPTSRSRTVMLSTAADYLRFAQMLLRGGELDGARVLSPESVAAMLRNRLPDALTPIETGVWDHRGYGFGLGGAVLVDPALDDLPGAPGIYRWAGSSGTFFWIDPEADLVAILLTQTRGTRYRAEREFQRLVYAAVER